MAVSELKPKDLGDRPQAETVGLLQYLRANEQAPSSLEARLIVSQPVFLFVLFVC